MRLRLKTKLVLAITGLVCALVFSLAVLAIRQVLQMSLDDAYRSGESVASTVFSQARADLEIAFHATPQSITTDPQMRDFATASLKGDEALQRTCGSILSYYKTIYDVSIVDLENHIIANADQDRAGQVAPERVMFKHLVQADFITQVRSVFSRTHESTFTTPMQLHGRDFAYVRVTMSTVFLRDLLKPEIKRALMFSIAAILLSVLLAASLSNFALRPLEMIGEQLDRMALAEESESEAKEESDGGGEVSRKVDRIGRQMRDVQEVFSALKDNLDQIMANLQDGIMLFTREKRAVLVSASIETFLGKPRRELLGYTVDEIFRANIESSPLDSLVKNAFREQHTFQNLEVKNRSGKTVLASLDLIEEAGEHLGALLTLRDAESVRKIEDELEISRRLSAIGRLTSGVAHEVKNPINAIVVHLEVLRQKLHEVPPDTRRHMDIISNEIRRLDRVVQTLVEFYRPVELKVGEFDLNRLVDDVVMLARLEAASNGQQVVVETSARPLVVRADYDLLKQALLNIVINGLQAMQEQGNGTLTLSTLESDGAAAIRVRDQGPGIPPEIQDKIYNLYFTTKAQGSGIGLAMTYRILQLHSGALQFKTGDRGTEFTMELPLAEENHVAAESVRQGTA